MTLEPVITYEEALAVALIRNECCRWMTGNSKRLTVGEQLAFFAKIQKSNGWCFLLARNERVPCGYAIIRKLDKNRACLTGGLAECFRGEGLGKMLFKRILSWCEVVAFGKPWLEVLRTNRRAINLYRSLGFTVTRKTRRTLEMELA